MVIRIAATRHVDFVDPGPWIQGGIDNAGQMENQTGTLDGCPDVVLFPDVTKIKLQGKTVKRLQTLSGLEKNPNGFTGITAGKSVYQDIADMPGSAGHQNQGHRLLTRPRSGIRAKD